MSFRGTGAYETRLTPEDQDVIETLGAFINGAKKSNRFSVYGCTIRPFFDAVLAAEERGVDSWGLFDHSEAAGPKEHAEVVRFYSLSKFPSHYLIGTSPIARQILHLKGDWTDHSAVVPYSGPAGQFATWQEAQAAGYPCTWSGSWNFSDSASKQWNNADIMPGADRAAAFDKAFEDIFQWIAANEQQYQIAVSPA